MTNKLQLPPLALYIHLPWCERKCPYCDFNSHETQQLPEQAYVDVLLADLAQDLAKTKQHRIETVFIGGGTPSLFSAAAITRLLTDIDQLTTLAADVEITLEVNPGSAEADKFADFQAAGINRLSIGIQSFDNNCLKQLGRVHSAEQAQKAIDMAKTAGFKRINLDLMHGLPSQTTAMALNDLKQALAYDTGHISWYQLTIEPNTIFYKQPPLLPVEDELANIQEAGEQILINAGYSRYEVSAWSRLDHQCRHNLNYWQFGDYLGIGAGAHGKLTDPDNNIITRYSKTRMPADYMNTNGWHWASQKTLSATQRREEFLLNALRLNQGFDIELYQQRSGLKPESLQPELQQQIDRGLLHHCNGNISATPLGQNFLDSLVAEFLSADIQ